MGGPGIGPPELGLSAHDVGTPVLYDCPMDSTKCRHKVPADRCPIHARILADAPSVRFDDDARSALDDALTLEG